MVQDRYIASLTRPEVQDSTHIDQGQKLATLLLNSCAVSRVLGSGTAALHRQLLVQQRALLLSHARGDRLLIPLHCHFLLMVQRELQTGMHRGESPRIYRRQVMRSTCNVWAMRKQSLPAGLYFFALSNTRLRSTQKSCK